MSKIDSITIISINQLQDQILDFSWCTTEDQIVDEMNKKYAITHTGTTCVLIEKEEFDFVLDSHASFLHLFENQRFFSEKDKKYLSVAQIWLKSPKRRSFLKGIVFDPTRKGHFDGKYNIFKGYPYVPKPGECSLFWKHVFDVICSGDKEFYCYLRKWIAHMFQKPQVLSTAVVLIGLQGTGKGVFVNAIGALLGSHYAPISSLDQVLGRFNSHLKSAILIFADEAAWCGNKKEIGILKAFITESKIFIEPKGKDGYWIINFRHLILSSNETHVVHLDPDDRRFFILEVSDSHKEDIPYFRAIEEQLKNGGYEALLYDLLNEDLSSFDPRIMPANFAGFNMKLKSASSFDNYLYKALKEGFIDFTNSVPSRAFGEIKTQEFYGFYKQYCLDQRQETMKDFEIGKRLPKLIPGVQVKRSGRDGDSQRPNIYVFPTLEECRKSFEKSFKQNSKIWD
jgi:Family of unknown function (DUF5906)